MQLQCIKPRPPCVEQKLQLESQQQSLLRLRNAIDRPLNHCSIVNGRHFIPQVEAAITQFVVFQRSLLLLYPLLGNQPIRNSVWPFGQSNIQIFRLTAEHDHAIDEQLAQHRLRQRSAGFPPMQLTLS
ncbi:hypothetical protein [Serratia marcescens]|uniref:hypothetical protein n=1 Tax=Serratia marcescens TaxID=615 RepID=UPI0016460648|nr:hypothetical protein [Serratia marcescens]